MEFKEEWSGDERGVIGRFHYFIVSYLNRFLINSQTDRAYAAEYRRGIRSRTTIPPLECTILHFATRMTWPTCIPKSLSRTSTIERPFR